MGTPFSSVYEAFLSLVDADEWDDASQLGMEYDLFQIMKAAISWFKHPRIPLTFGLDSDKFDNEITNSEIQVIAHYMRYEWYGRVVDSGENLKPMYTERDFSPANLLGEFRQKQESGHKLASRLEKNYYRSIDGKPFDFSRLSGG